MVVLMGVLVLGSVCGFEDGY